MLKIKLILALTFILALAACGGGSSSSSSNTVSTGIFTDAGPVSGMQYQTATQSGVTDSNGQYSYLPGETITFKVGNIVLGQAVAGSAMNAFTLVGMTPPLTSLGVTTNAPNGRLFQQAINISLFLQTLDTDTNPQNGIAISSQAIELAASTTINFNQKYQVFSDSFALKQYIARLRAAGLWGGTRQLCCQDMPPIACMPA
jgi:hypothetical protein